MARRSSLPLELLLGVLIGVLIALSLGCSVIQDEQWRAECFERGGKPHGEYVAYPVIHMEGLQMVRHSAYRWEMVCDYPEHKLELSDGPADQTR